MAAKVTTLIFIAITLLLLISEGDGFTGTVPGKRNTAPVSCLRRRIWNKMPVLCNIAHYYILLLSLLKLINNLTNICSNWMLKLFFPNLNEKAFLRLS